MPELLRLKFLRSNANDLAGQLVHLTSLEEARKRQREREREREKQDYVKKLARERLLVCLAHHYRIGHSSNTNDHYEQLTETSGESFSPSTCSSLELSQSSSSCAPVVQVLKLESQSERLRETERESQQQMCQDGRS